MAHLSSGTVSVVIGICRTSVSESSSDLVSTWLGSQSKSMWIPCRVGHFLDSSRAEGIWHTWDSTSLSVTRVSSDCLLALSDTALRLEAAHLEQCLLASGTSRIVALFRWLWLSWSLFACTPLMIESIKCHRGLYIHSPLE